jgi:hypothetical protein
MPVVTVNDVVWPELLKIRDVIQRLLGDDFVDPLDVPDDDLTLFVREIGQALRVCYELGWAASVKLEDGSDPDGAEAVPE